MRIVVLAGGRSPEREVSLSTGTMVCKALRSKGHQAILIDVIKDYETAGDEEAFFFAHAQKELVKKAALIRTEAPESAISAEEEKKPLFGKGVLELCQAADKVFLALHGAEGENGKVQAAFDLFGISYTGSGCLSSALAMNKKISKQLFTAAGIPTPEFYTLTEEESNAKARSYPCVVKPVSGGSSIGVSIVRNEEEWKQALCGAFRYEKEILVEEYVEGREFSVGILGKKALPVIEILPKEGFYDYKNKYQVGRTLEDCPARISEEMHVMLTDCALWAASVLEIDTYARVDFIADRAGSVYCLEVNTLPGMTPASLLPQEAEAAGIRFEDLCEVLVKGQEKDIRKKSLQTHSSTLRFCDSSSLQRLL